MQEMKNKTYYNILKGMEIPKWHHCPIGNKIALEVLLLDSFNLKKDLQKQQKTAGPTCASLLGCAKIICK